MTEHKPKRPYKRVNIEERLRQNIMRLQKQRDALRLKVRQLEAMLYKEPP